VGAWLVYIVRCRDGTLYTGVTNDLPRRIRAHDSGAASRYTRSRRPVRLVFSERSRGRSAAQRREARIKRLDRREKLLLIGSSRSRVPYARAKSARAGRPGERRG
jgi:putative endonuclease